MKRHFLHVLILVLCSVSLFAKNTTEKLNDDISKTNSILFNDIVTQDTFYVQTSDCTGTGDVCIDIAMSDVGNYTFSDNGMMYSEGFQACSATEVEMKLTVGTHLIQVLENGGAMCLDSFFVNVVCVQPNIENYTFSVDSVHIFCFDNSEFLGTPTTTEILCPNNAGTPANFDLINGNNCVEITALSLGQDTACYVICDNFGICDTTNIYVEVVPPVFNGTVSWIIDTIYVNSTQQICIDTSEMVGQVVGISNGCPGQSGEFAIFSVDGNSYCVDYSAVDIGKDTACIEVIDNYGNVDTTYIVAYVSTAITDTLFQSVSLGNVGNLCIDTTQLGGTISSVEDLCTDGASGAAAFTFDANNYCYEILTSEVGQDTACIVLCDNFGTCDTTILIVEVTEATITNLVAVDDVASILLGEQLDLNICDNDTIPDGFLTNYYILPISFGGAGPNDGLVSFESECNIVYLPTAQSCGVQDSFHYVICNTDGCDTALITVNIECENTNAGPLEFASGFSPNGDEVNQFFTIKGVEELPSSSLTIYNRWGNQVYNAENYQNDWDGTFNGSSLMNGTYFYLFQDDRGNTYRGYVYLQR